MINDARFGGFDTVIVWKLDRFARNRKDSADYKAILRERGVDVLSATERISQGADGILLESVLEGQAEYYSADLSEKVKRGLTENVLKGKAIGGSRPFGYRTENGVYVLDGQEAPLVKEMYRLYVDEGLNMCQIADRLTKQGHTRSDGKPIKHNTVEKVIGSRRYIGELRCDGCVNPNGYPRLIDDETFEKACQKRQKHRHSGGAFKADEDFALTGRLFCGECKGEMIGDSGTSKSGKRHMYYRCEGHRKKICDLKPIRKEDAEFMVCDAIQMLLSDQGLEKKMADAIYRLQQKVSPEAKVLQERLRKNEKETQNILAFIKDGNFSKTLQSEILRLEAEKDSLEKGLEEEESKFRPLTRNEIVAAIDILMSEPIDTAPRRRPFISRFVDRVDVYKDGRMSIVGDFFGVKMTIEAIKQAEKDNLSVRMEVTDPRHRQEHV